MVGDKNYVEEYITTSAPKISSDSAPNGACLRVFNIPLSLLATPFHELTLFMKVRLFAYENLSIKFHQQNFIQYSIENAQTICHECSSMEFE
jgi:hypothetical protein